MAIDNANYPSELDIASPASNEPVGEADSQIRAAKRAINQGFPNVSGEASATHTELNYVVGVTSSIQPQIDDVVTDTATNTGDIALKAGLADNNVMTGDNDFQGDNDFTGDFKKSGTSTLHSPAGGSISSGSTLDITKGILSVADGGVSGAYRNLDITLVDDATAASGVLFAVVNGAGALLDPLLWKRSAQIDINTIRVAATTRSLGVPNFADISYNVTIYDTGL